MKHEEADLSRGQCVPERVIDAIAESVEAGVGAKTASAAVGISPRRFDTLRERGEQIEDKISAWYGEHPDEEDFLVDEDVLERLGIPTAERRCWRLVREVEAAQARAIATCLKSILQAATGWPSPRTTTTVRQQLDKNGELVTLTTTQTVTTTRRDWRAAAWLLDYWDAHDQGTAPPRSGYEPRHNTGSANVDPLEGVQQLIRELGPDD